MHCNHFCMKLCCSFCHVTYGKETLSDLIAGLVAVTAVIIAHWNTSTRAIKTIGIPQVLGGYCAYCVNPLPPLIPLLMRNKRSWINSVIGGPKP